MPPDGSPLAPWHGGSGRSPHAPPPGRSSGCRPYGGNSALPLPLLAPLAPLPMPWPAAWLRLRLYYTCAARAVRAQNAPQAHTRSRSCSHRALRLRAHLRRAGRAPAASCGAWRAHVSPRVSAALQREPLFAALNLRRGRASQRRSAARLRGCSRARRGRRRRQRCSSGGGTRRRGGGLGSASWRSALTPLARRRGARRHAYRPAARA